MNKKISFTAIFFIMIHVCSVCAVWVYTPKDGKWTNPKYAPKETPRDQFQNAQNFEKQKKYAQAAQEYKQLVKTFPTSKLLPSALFNAAVCFEKDNNYWHAFLAYQDLLDRYPAYEDYQDIVERQFKIGNLFLSGKKRKLWKFSILPAHEQTIQIFEKVIENLPFNELAVQAQFNIGLTYEKIKEYSEAIKAYKDVLSKYPENPLVVDALYRIGLCAYKHSGGSDYDQSFAQEALRSFKHFVARYPEAELADDALKKIQILENREAEGIYSVGLFYEKDKDFKAARVYYNDVIGKYPSTGFAKKARQRLKKIEKN